MLDIAFIRDNAAAVKKNCKQRQVNADIDRLLALDTERRSTVQALEERRALRKKTSKQKPSAEEIAHMKLVGEEITTLEKKREEVESALHELLWQVPNLTHPETPIGGEADWRVIATHGQVPKFFFPPKDHEELLLAHDLIDFDRAAKVAGAKFYYAKGDLLRFNLALLRYGIDIAAKHGFLLLETPDLAKQEILRGAGFNPRGEEKQIYNIEDTDLSLVGTAEITVLGYHANEVLDLSQGPKRYAALSHCFRTEAGAYGKASKGLYRVHQFTKLELFIFCAPSASEAMHQELLGIEKEICDGIGFPYRVIEVASGDLGGPAYRKFDVEAWMTMKNDYGEITSTSNCTDYQARRLNIKYKTEKGKADLVHTLNGTAMVTSRFPIAIVENYQQKDGSIMVPRALQSYFGKEKIG